MHKSPQWIETPCPAVAAPNQRKTILLVLLLIRGLLHHGGAFTCTFSLSIMAAFILSSNCLPYLSLWLFVSTSCSFYRLAVLPPASVNQKHNAPAPIFRGMPWASTIFNGPRRPGLQRRMSGFMKAIISVYSLALAGSTSVLRLVVCSEALQPRLLILMLWVTLWLCPFAQSLTPWPFYGVLIEL